MNPSSNTTEHRFIEPLDVLFLRANKLFGDPGSYGESLVPPWPSAAAGALRSHILVHDGIDLQAFAVGRVDHPSLGTPKAPGSFALTDFMLARRQDNGNVETLHAFPADLVVSKKDDDYHLKSLHPHVPPSGLLSSSAFAQIPVLAETERRKAETGLWLTRAGWLKYLNGQLPDPKQDIVKTNDLWAIDSRVGIGMNADTRSADDGKLFTTQAVALRRGVGFLASVRGANLPPQGVVRLGGDGRAASSQSVSLIAPSVDLHAVLAQERCRLVLTTPGIFKQGCLPNGFHQQDDGSYLFDLQGVRARLVCAAVPRAETISGWDLAHWQPKAAMRAAPSGSVYWLDDLQTTTESLGKLADNGFWSEHCEDSQRRAEGFNRFSIAAFDCA